MENILKRVRKTLGTSSREQWQERDSWKYEVKKFTGKAVGFRLVLGGPSIKMP